MHFVRRLFVIAVATVIIPASLLLPGFVLAQNDPNANVALTVKSYFADIPVMIAIATCESGPRQFAANGSPLLGGNGVMVGVFQIDETIHTGIAASLGFDINTLTGNLGYARYLYGEDGTEPWISSFPCWNALMATNATTSTPTSTTTTTATTTPTTAPALTLDLSLGSIDPQVLILQQLLNKAGYTLTQSGPGSPGNETTKFGALTYAALKAFQCAQGIACSGEEATTGYGFLNAATRTALLAATSGTTTGTTNISGSTSSSTVSSTASGTQPVAVASTTVVAVATPTTTSASTTDNPAEVAELQSRIAALVVIVQQLEAEIAAHFSH
jgi:peptidoglycan hydrolase-like protein with peptidoglycan-binding domain